MGKVIDMQSARNKKVASENQYFYQDGKRVSKTDFDPELSDDGYLDIFGISGDVHTIQVSVIREVISGEKSILDIDRINDILPVIFEEWLNGISFE